MNRITKTLFFTLLLLPNPVTGQGLAEHFKNEYKSKYMVFHYNDDVTRSKSLAEFCDGFIDVINTEFFKAEFKYPIHAYVLKDRDSYKSFMTKMEMLAESQTAGIYLTGIYSFVTYEDAGYGTFAHEIMHPLARVNLGRAPLWTVEGILGFFEMFFGTGVGTSWSCDSDSIIPGGSGSWGRRYSRWILRVSSKHSRITVPARSGWSVNFSISTGNCRSI